MKCTRSTYQVNLTLWTNTFIILWDPALVFAYVYRKQGYIMISTGRQCLMFCSVHVQAVSKTMAYALGLLYGVSYLLAGIDICVLCLK